MSISGPRAVRKLTELIAQRGKPGMIVSENGIELTSNAALVWCGGAEIEWHYTMSGKLMVNAFVESFNDRLRDQRLNTHWFLSLAGTRGKIKAWRRDYYECLLTPRRAG